MATILPPPPPPPDVTKWSVSAEGQGHEATVEMMKINVREEKKDPNLLK